MSSSIPMPAPVAGSLKEGAATYSQILGRAGGHEVTSVMRGQDGGSIAVTLYTSPAYNLQLPPLKVSRLSVNLTPACVTGGIAGERDRTFVARRHSLFFTPAGAPTRWRKTSPSRHLNLYFRPAAEEDDGQDELGRRLRQDGPVFNIVLPGSGALIARLAAEVSAGRPFSVEAVEGLALLLLVQLGRRHLDPGSPQPLSAQQLARLEDYISANLGERILVADLAAVVGLSTVRFARAFTRQRGRSPHQYVLSRRVDEAVAMLKRGHSSLAEVAAACGFASQQHMTAVFRARLGVTPASVRRAG